jgi:hypothetical protein
MPSEMIHVNGHYLKAYQKDELHPVRGKLRADQVLLDGHLYTVGGQREDESNVALARLHQALLVGKFERTNRLFQPFFKTVGVDPGKDITGVFGSSRKANAAYAKRKAPKTKTRKENPSGLTCIVVGGWDKEREYLTQQYPENGDSV